MFVKVWIAAFTKGTHAKGGVMNSHWFRPFGSIAAIVAGLAVTAQAADPVFLGYGSAPQWSPSGGLIGAWRGDTLVVFDVAAGKEVKTIPVQRPKFFYWFSEDSIALSYQGRTEAAIPRYRETIVTHAVLDLNGHFKRFDCDTLEDERNYITHWRKLPNGKVGAFELRDGVPTKFLVPGGDGFVEADPDTSARSSCWHYTPKWARESYPSPDCSRAFVISRNSEMKLTDSSGLVLRDFGKRLVQIGGGKYTIMDRPAWASDGTHLSFTKYTEDGHFLYATEIIVIDPTSNKEQVVAQVTGQDLLSCNWAPADARLAITEKGRISVWQPGH